MVRPVTPHDLLIKLKTRGVALRLEKDRLQFAPGDGVTPELLESMKRAKAELIHYLQERKICELLHRYHLRQFKPDVTARLEGILCLNPPDAWQRLLVACDYLSVTGDALEALADEALRCERILN